VSGEPESLVAALLDALPVPVFYKDRSGRYLGVNVAYETFTGQSEAELVGRRISDLWDPESARSYGESDQVLLATGGTQVYETTMVRADGETRHVVIHKAVFESGDGTAQGVVGQILDLTEQKRAEAAARKAAAVKGEFLANMSHELRTPMNGVIGMTSLLADTNLDREQDEFVNAIRTSGETLMAVIDDILDFSKLEAGKLEIEAVPISLRSCLEDSLDMVAYTAAQKGLDLAYSVDHDLPDTYVGDGTRIRQILNNLLSNACKFTDAGEILVSVSPDTEGLQISVHDTGIGIPKNRRHRLFQSFSQVDNSTTRRFGGTGLGLAISRQLARLMDGDLTVASNPGVGSTFTLTLGLPLAADQTPLRYQRGFDGDLADTQVLVVDDNKTNRRILHRQLTAWRMSPVVVGSGVEALALISTGSEFDLAILDMRMPLMDGTTLARCLRALRPNMPLALLSSIGAASGSDPELFAVRMTKPVKPTALFDALLSLFGTAPASAATTKRRGAIEPEAVRELRILMAEDNLVNQKVAVGLLRRLGYEIDVVGDGLEAVDAVARTTYDVVLMDLHMPELGGSAAAEQIRAATPPGREPWIIALTADVLPGTREACLASGMDDFVTKPLNREALANALALVPEQAQRSDR
jgi:PAS domain S-box-containing protein